MSGFEKFLHATQKINFWCILLRENEIFCFFKSMILNWKFQYASDFDLKDLQRVGFGIEKKNISKVVLNVSFFPF